jgi:hypothetical protein
MVDYNNSTIQAGPWQVPQGQAGFLTAKATSCAMKKGIKVKINMKKKF